MPLADRLPNPPEEPSILFLDIENAPNLGYVWGKYEQTVVKYEHESFMMAVAYKWQHQKRVYVKSLPDFDGYEEDRYSDENLVDYAKVVPVGAEDIMLLQEKGFSYISW